MFRRTSLVGQQFLLTHFALPLHRSEPAVRG